jgi:branched-chain amino acid transport system substrate-binding protein
LLLEAGYYEHAVLINRQLKDLKWTPKALAYSVGPQLPEFAKTLKKDAHGALAVGFWHPSMQYKDEVFGSVQGYIEWIRKKHGKEIMHLQGLATGNCLVMQRALKEAGSLDQVKLRDAMAKLEIKESLIGAVKFDSRGVNMWYSTAVLQVQGLDQKVVYPEKAANAKFHYPLVPWDKR